MAEPYSYETLLEISAFTSGLPLGSARGVTQTFEHIGQSTKIRRTLNGVPKLISDPILVGKLASNISCADIETILLDTLYEGATVLVDCVAELSYLTAVGAPAKPIVPDSSRTAGAYTFYRPRLSMCVMAISINFDEYENVTSWSMDLEEI